MGSTQLEPTALAATQNAHPVLPTPFALIAPMDTIWLGMILALCAPLTAQSALLGLRVPTAQTGTTSMAQHAANAH